jgi:ATP-dependent protease ClpP protease subunit
MARAAHAKGRIGMNRIYGFVIAFLFLAPGHASAAEFSYIDYEPFEKGHIEGAAFLLLSGDIIPGDLDRLVDKILENEAPFLITHTIVLASDGGDVAEALKIAKLVKAMDATVLVGPVTGRCVSACFLIYAAANERGTFNAPLVGIHRPYIISSQMAKLSPAQAEHAETDALERARAFLIANNVPTYLIEEMFRRSSEDVYWLTEADIQRLGYRAPWFDQYLIAKCGWKGKTPIDVQTMDAMTCRLNFTSPVAMKAISQAFAARFAAAHKLMINAATPCHTKGTVDPKTMECPE